MTTTLDIQTQGRIARVYLNRPEVRNAFNDGVITELADTFTRLGQDPGLRDIVLGGHGKAFCARADLAGMRLMADYELVQTRAHTARHPAPPRSARVGAPLTAPMAPDGVFFRVDDAAGARECDEENNVGMLAVDCGPM